MKKRTLSEEIVVSKALEIAQESGFEAISLSGVAKALDIQPQSMYNYAKNSRDLRTKALTANLTKLTQRLYRELMGMTGREALEKLVDLILYSDAQNLAVRDLSMFAQYRQEAVIVQAFSGLHDLILQLIKSLVSGEVAQRRATQLLIDLVLGQNVVGTRTVQNRDDFQANLRAILDMISEK